MYYLFLKKRVKTSQNCGCNMVKNDFSKMYLYTLKYYLYSTINFGEYEILCTSMLKNTDFRFG